MRCSEAGAASELVVHGRTKAQDYRAEAYRLAGDRRNTPASATIPVIANMAKSGLAGARGHVWRPAAMRCGSRPWGVKYSPGT